MGLYILHSGNAKLEMRQDRTGTSIHFETSGDSLLGLPAALSGEPFTLTAIAAKGSRISFIDRSGFCELLEINAALSLKALKIMAAEIRAARTALLSALAKS